MRSAVISQRATTLSRLAALATLERKAVDRARALMSTSRSNRSSNTGMDAIDRVLALVECELVARREDRR